MKCSICGNKIEAVLMGGRSVWTEGHNAQPVNDGRCCGACNELVVLERRITDLRRDRYTEYTYDEIIRGYEDEGMTRSDAQAVVDAMLEDLDRKVGIKGEAK